MKNMVKIRVPGADRMRRFVTNILLRTIDLKRFVEGDKFDEGQPFDMYAFNQAHRVHPWVYKCVSTISLDAAEVPVPLYSKHIKNNRTRFELADNHPIAALLKQPAVGISGADLRETVLAHKLLDGNAYIAIFRTGASANVLMPLRPDRVKVMTDDKGAVIGYLYTVGSEMLRFDEADVIHFKMFSSYNDHYGASPLEALRMTLLTDVEARKWNLNTMRNSAIPRGALTTDQKMSDPEYKRMELNWNKAHKGSDYIHRVALLTGGLKWVNIGMNQTEMDFVGQLKMDKSEFGDVYGLPPSKMGDYSHVRANAQVQEQSYWHGTMQPHMRKYADTLTLNIWKLEGKPPASQSDFCFRPDYTDVLPLVRERNELRKSENESIKIGRTTINEARKRDDMDEVPWGDTYWKPANLQAVEDSLSGDSGVSDDSDNVVIAATNVAELAVEQQNNWWRRFIIKTDAFEAQVRGFSVTLFSAQERIMLTRLKRLAATKLGVKPRSDDGLSVVVPAICTEARDFTEAEIETVLFDLESAVNATAKNFDPLLKTMVNAGGQEGLAMAAVASTFDLADPDVARFILDKEQKFAQKVNETTWKRAKASLAEGAKAGESAVKLADRIEATMKSRRANKYTIARTEVLGAVNGGVAKGMKQSGVVETKIWVTAGDGNERDSHANASGQEVPIDGVFTLAGGLLEFPGDPAGPAEEVIECRCTVAAGKVSTEQ